LHRRLHLEPVDVVLDAPREERTRQFVRRLAKRF
jgi:hypothetical protein